MITWIVDYIRDYRGDVWERQRLRVFGVTIFAVWTR